jgi:hypothetical protein
MQLLFPCELKKARPPEYLLVLYDGGEEEKIKSQVNIVVKTLIQANFINMNAL